MKFRLTTKAFQITGASLTEVVETRGRVKGSFNSYEDIQILAIDQQVFFGEVGVSMIPRKSIPPIDDNRSWVSHDQETPPPKA